ncbi:small integral membrane protein 20 isoform X1 [Accipiter gentilis]|uniref:small integral membrane protein 20 isoform X1 n=1 Tax=Astur gentilis TaxID=8957 RepID=UPI002110A215|nr:small integral membrane protein 20 isoform X1 [Accipiter gentilis]
MRQIRLPGGGAAARAGQGPRRAPQAHYVQEEDFSARFLHIFRGLPSSLINIMEDTWKNCRERTVNKPSWYCSRGYSACRVKSVV